MPMRRWIIVSVNIISGAKIAKFVQTTYEIADNSVINCSRALQRFGKIMVYWDMFMRTL